MSSAATAARPLHRTAVVLFTRDLRVHDHPALTAACEHAERIVPLFVLDAGILGSSFGAPNRVAFLLDALADLRAQLRHRGSDLILRRGEVVEETLRLVRETDATTLVCSADVSRYARRREERLAAACEQERVGFQAYPGVTVVPAGELLPTGGDHYRVFTPYWRAWEATSWREALPAPDAIGHPRVEEVGDLPDRAELSVGPFSPSLPTGGETPGRRLLERAVEVAESGEPDLDDLAADDTSRLSPYLHLGCVSPLEAALRLQEASPAQVRQLAWRDFHHQVLLAFPDLARRDYRDRGAGWRRDDAALQAWQDGTTGIPVVDAGMRQLRSEGWMHNRARLITASFLTRMLGLDWRLGADHYVRWLVDGDLANNAGNWQWVAGTGNNTQPNRVLSPLRQARRFDPDGHYVRRHVPELAGVAGKAVHAPWLLPEDLRAGLDYPAPLVEL